MDDEFGPGFVPSPVQKAHADQQFALARNAVEKLVALVDRTASDAPVQVGLLAADVVADEMTTDDDQAVGAAIALAAVAICLLAESRAHPLLPLGGEARQEWGVADVPDHPAEVWLAESEPRARLKAASSASVDGKVYCRTITTHVGPWRAVS